MRQLIITSIFFLACSPIFAQTSDLEKRVEQLEATVKILKEAYDESVRQRQIIVDQFKIGPTIDHVENPPLTFDLIKLVGNKNSGEVQAEVTISNKNTDKDLKIEQCYLLDSKRKRTHDKYSHHFKGIEDYGAKITIHNENQVNLLMSFQLDEVDTKAVQQLEIIYSIMPVGSTHNTIEKILFRNYVIDWK